MNRNTRTILLEREEHMWQLWEYYTKQAAIWGTTGVSAEQATRFALALESYYAEYGQV